MALRALSPLRLMGLRVVAYALLVIVASACSEAPLTPADVAPGGAVRTARPNCDPAYPSVCIPPPPPDLDCNQISFRRFEVRRPDPHNFDADRDGIGCEN